MVKEHCSLSQEVWQIIDGETQQKNMRQFHEFPPFFCFHVETLSSSAEKVEREEHWVEQYSHNTWPPSDHIA